MAKPKFKLRVFTIGIRLVQRLLWVLDGSSFTGNKYACIQNLVEKMGYCVHKRLIFDCIGFEYPNSNHVGLNGQVGHFMA